MLLSFKNIKKDFDNVEVLKDISLDIKKNKILGIVGRNGAGKSTLVDIIFGLSEKDEGKILFHQPEIKAAYLRQNGSYELNILCKANSKKDKDITLNYNMLEFTSELGLEKFYTWDNVRLDNLSGGERTKVSLANIWNFKPQLLILDEPTNNMDFKGVNWLLSELEKFNGSVIIISHDRYFLDKAVDEIIEIEDGKSIIFEGNYSFYKEEKERRFKAQLKQYKEEQSYREKIEEDIDNLKNWSEKAHRESRKKALATGNKMGGKEYFRVKAKKKDVQVKSKIKKLEKLKVDGVEKPKEDKKIYFEFNSNAKGGKRLLEFKNVSKAFGKNVLFNNSSFYINRGEKIGIFGENGTGKSTLIKIIIGEEKLNNGEMWISDSLEIAYLSQNVVDLDSEITPLELIGELPRDNMGKVRTMLFNMGLSNRILDTKIKYLSFGEKMKVKLAGFILKNYPLIILDEPENHIDLPSREQLEEALINYEGTVIIVSHDRYMMEKVCNKMIVIENKMIKRYEKNIKDINLMESHNSLTNDELKSKLMVIENKIAEVLGKLSMIANKDEKYLELEQQFNILLKEKSILMDRIKSK
ncbi:MULTISPECIES: ribosomal protection-like ABC-F family protein [unclassified Clostridium]|uniref:ribosomal protection-like ABC-F family protein n=1 Tax=unclassified Clostridium TaxID=2614128 RepID=UPI0025BC066F|nr:MULTISPECIES: ABC-F family ATP-binding cassette domain-containing protein [unclassified Clostridium]